MSRARRFLLHGVGGCAAAFVALLVLAYHSPLARWTDARALEDFSYVQHRPLLGPLSESLIRLADPAGLAGLTAVVVLAGLLARRPRHAVAAVVLIVGAGLTSELLKPLLAEPRTAFGVAHLPPEGFPSGHATAAMSAALAGVIVAPPTWRWLAAAVGAVLVPAVSFSILSLAWHFPSDVLGGYLVATGWCFAVLAGFSAAAVRWPVQPRRDSAIRVRSGSAGPHVPVAPAVAAVAAGLALFTAVVLARYPDLDSYAVSHTAAVGVAAVITVAALALLGLVTVAAGGRR